MWSCWRTLVFSVGAAWALLLAGCGGTEPPAESVAFKEVPPAAAAQRKKSPPANTSASLRPGEAAPKPGARPANRLAQETSPYLLLHAHNPVDWYPWGAEALAKAKQEQKLIFLSIGYSSCHWCHVMERESFSDEEIARFLNEHFVCIKVDREERPDVDAAFMAALYVFNEMAQTRRGGGWPLSLFLTPEGEPFFGATYFPARDGDRPGQLGFLSLVERVEATWRENADQIREDAQLITRVTKEYLERRPAAALLELKPELLEEGQKFLAAEFDAVYGGFGFSPENGARPKFPEPSQLLFLLARAQRGNAEARQLLTVTLDHLARGGIRDHLGGGFHRYSVDRYWRIPHFEKMLYDNGQLATVYAGAFALTRQPEYEAVLRELCDFVLREMTAPEGGFYAALDADSEHEEGKFYRWEKSELEPFLSEPNGELFARVYSLAGAPNFENTYYVPQRPTTLAALAAQEKLEPAELLRRVAPVREKLWQARSHRVRPLTDTKVLTSWNGLMIRGLADAGQALQEPRYTAAAERAARFVLASLRNREGRLYRSFAQGQAKTDAYLDDYANFVDGLLALHRATGKAEWLSVADSLTQLQLSLFADDTHGGYFSTTPQHELLFARMQDASDGVEPCGNSVTADNLLYLSAALQQPQRRATAERTMRATLGLARGNMAAVPRTATALVTFLDTAAVKEKP